MKLDGLTAAIDAQGLNVYGVVVRQHNREVASHRWRSDDRVNLHSASKSYASTAVGMAAEAGLLALDAPVVSFFPHDLPSHPDPKLGRLTVEHLLNMASGHDAPLLMGEGRDRLPETNWVRYYFSQPLALEPGARFVYDSGDTYLLSAILQRATGQTLRDYLIPRLFQPLGIPNPQWFTCPRGITLGAGGLFLTTREMTYLGQVYLDGGQWQGQPLVPASWVASVQHARIATHDEGDDGYGYSRQFWMCSRPGAYRMHGKYGQVCLILPDLDAVVAVTSHIEGSDQPLLDAIWQYLIPELEGGF